MANGFQYLLSVILIVEDRGPELRAMLEEAVGIAREIAEDYEIVVIDNGSTDGTPDILRALCGEDGLENLQVYVLTKREDIDVAAWAGLENALGDYVALIDPLEDDVAALPKLLEAAHTGVDVVFAQNDQKRPKSVLYGLASRIFSSAAHTFLKIDRDRELPFYRVLSRKTVNYMLRYDAASFSYRWLPALSGFRKVTVPYTSRRARPAHNFLADISRGMRILITSTAAPMRLVTVLSLFGAGMNLVYSGYVILIALFKEDVAPGWVTLSLQQSGMFFLFSLVFLIIGEYLLHTARLSSSAPVYHFSEEFTSAVITRRQRLNVEVNETQEAELLKAASLRVGS